MKKCCERFSHLFWQGHAHFGWSSLFPSRGFCPLPTELNVYFLAASVVHNLLEVLDHLLIKLNLTSRISTFDVKIRFWRSTCGPGAGVGLHWITSSHETAFCVEDEGWVFLQPLLVFVKVGWCVAIVCLFVCSNIGLCWKWISFQMIFSHLQWKRQNLMKYTALMIVSRPDKHFNVNDIYVQMIQARVWATISLLLCYFSPATVI